MLRSGPTTRTLPRAGGWNPATIRFVLTRGCSVLREEAGLFIHLSALAFEVRFQSDVQSEAITAGQSRQ